MRHPRFFLFLLTLLASMLAAPITLAQNQPTTAIAGRSSNPAVLRIEALQKKIQDEGRTVDKLTESDLADLPVGIARNIGGTVYIIAIDSAYSDERGWFLSAYASVTLPGSTSPIAFAARNIAFSKGGLNASSQTRLVLVSPQTIPLRDMDLVLPADGHNYLEFDCNGFKAVNLKGEFLLPPDQFIPAPLTTGAPTPNVPVAPIPAGPLATTTPGIDRVRATFEVNTSDLSNIIASVGITPFQVKGLEDFSFSVRNATVDMSDLANPAGFSFPADYQQAYGEDITLWRGFYLQEVDIAFQGLDSSSKKMPVISARNLLIDDAGVSGLFSATNILPIGEGSADGWPFSVDRLSVRLDRNRLAGGGLAGVMNVPFLGKDTLGYSADMEQVDNKLSYKFSVITRKDKTFNIPLAVKAHPDSGSRGKAPTRSQRILVAHKVHIQFGEHFGYFRRRWGQVLDLSPDHKVALSHGQFGNIYAQHLGRTTDVDVPVFAVHVNDGFANQTARSGSLDGSH